MGYSYGFGYCLLYFLSHQIAFIFPDSDKILMTVWPAAGIGLAALLLSPRYLWPAILVAIFVSGNVANFFAGRPLINSLGFMTANVCESFCCAWLITKLCGINIRFTKIKEVLALICAATIINAFSAAIGAGVATLTHQSHFWSFWKTWWVADGLGILLIAPLIVTWSAPPVSLVKIRWSRVLEAGLIFALWCYSSWLLFSLNTNNSLISLQPYMLFIPLAWIAFRFEMRGVAAALVVFTGIAVTSKAIIAGPLIWGGDNIPDRLLQMQIYIGSMGVTAFLLAGSYSERNQTVKSLCENTERLNHATASVKAGVWDWNLRTNEMIWDDRMLELYGLTQENFPGGVEAWKQGLHPDDSIRAIEECEAALRGERDFDTEFRVLRPDKMVIHLKADGLVLRDNEGKPFRMIGLNTDITERKNSELVLNESERKFRTIADYTYDWENWVGADGKLIWISPSVKHIAGYSVSECMAMPDFPLPLIHPEDRSVMLEKYRKANELQLNDIEFRIIRKDGMVSWGSVSTNPVINNDGHHSGHRSCIRDITERKLAEEALRESGMHYRSLVEGIPCIVYAFSQKRGGVYYSSQVTKILGYSPEQLYAQPLLWHNSIHPDDLSCIEQVIRETATGKSFCVEYRIRDAHGNWHWLEDRSFGYKVDGADNVIEGLAFDITEHKQAEEALILSEEKYRLLADHMKDAIWLMDMNLKTIYVSPSIEKRRGYTFEEMAQLSPDKNYTPASFQRAMDYFSQEMPKAIANPTYSSERQIELEYACKDGSTYWSENKFSIIRDKNGKPISILGEGRDITDRKRVEEEKAKLENQLFQAQKMEAIGTLAGGIAHDFNNILGAIIGYTEMAVDETQREIQLECLQETLKGAERAKNLVKQILTFSRQDDHEKKPLDIKILLKEAIKFLRSSIPTTIEINQHLTEETCNILADPIQMHQVIMNLCTNASHAMKLTGGILKIELANVELTKDEIPNYPDLKPGHYAKLTISDTGYGIDPALIWRIFDPFFTTKSVDEGTGLGLSVVYGIVKNHNGAINVYSEPDKGASFNVYLPRIIQTEGIKVDTDKPLIGGKERILFVDDEPPLVKLGTRMLSPLGYEVTGVKSSAEALDIFSKTPQSFDLIITDMTLPKMTGIVLSREILKNRPGIPIILCSGIKDPDTEAQVNALGIKAYLTKPLTKRELARVVREALDGCKNALP